MSSLEAYNTPPQLIEVWKRAYGQELLPVQATAVARHGLMMGRNLIVQAPTSAGKTFVGEMAATRAALAGRKVLYLVPTKALAEDKLAQFSALYRPLGLRIIVTTRDRRQDDRRFLSGDFDIAIAIPEKVRALWARSGVSQFLGLAVIDELQTLSDPQRGPCLELLLAELRRLPGLQIVGLSACLGASPRLADYLQAEWLETEHRPVELRKGVLLGDGFRYFDDCGNLQEERFEGLGLMPNDSYAEAAARLTLYFARRKEPTILFVRDRATAVQLALAVAERLEEGPNTPEAARPEAYSAPGGPDGGDEATAIRPLPVSPLQDLERTAVREQIQRLMARGVAFHSADLQFEDRRAVEQAFSEGRLLVLCSTPTLAMGVNLPARNVIIDPQGWQSEVAGAPSALSPISRGDFENRAGRAGRLGWGDFGRGILLADCEMAAEALTARYLKSTFSSPEPALTALPPATAALTIAAGAAIRSTSLDETYAGTYSAYLQRQERLPEAIREAAQRCLQGGLLRESSPGALVPTPLGQRAAAAGTCFETFLWLAEWAGASRGAPTELEATFIAALATEAREAAGGGLGSRNDDCLQMLRRHAVEIDQEGELLERLLTDQRQDWRVRERAARMVLALYRWISPEETYEVERSVRLTAARLANLGEVIGWLIDTLADIGLERGWRAAEAERLRRHAECLAHGLRADDLPLSRLGCFGLRRDHIRQLVQAGLEQPEEIVAAGLERLEQIVPAQMARDLLLAARGRERPVADPERSQRGRAAGDCGPSPPAARATQPEEDRASPAEPEQPALVLSADQPHQVTFFGRIISLRPAEFRLLQTLAEKAGKCVSYDTLYARMWSEPLAQPGQIYAHRSRLCGKLGRALPERDPKQIVMTIPKHGLMLNLRPQEVLVT